MFEQNKSAAADSVATVSQTENVAAKDVKKSPIVSKSARTVEIKPANPLPKVNKVEMKKKADSLSSVIQLKKSNPSLTVSKIAKVESQITKSVGCSSSSTSNSRIKIKTESIDNCDNLSIKTEKTEPVSFVRNNFVENLKKNLSLAMNRKL
ncbi:hypothetical protein V9T40_004346 [Parthenolecanium corni]|uniref:Uncharacterized protein n=1 Tax=Parthenolecanium corni TaxID=536013 RepID=A0AAN9U3B5_9HEMI